MFIKVPKGSMEERKMGNIRIFKGQGIVEYALILVLVSVVVIVALALLGPTIGKVFSNIVTRI